MVKHPICAVTGSRAEFGLLRPLLVKLSESEEIELRLVVTGSHLSGIFGGTQSEIAESGLVVHMEIPFPLDGDSRKDMAKNTGTAMSAFAGYFAKNRPELLIVLGDRYEIFAAASAAALLGIPIAHLCGGETTEGAVDEFLRHSITKMSFLHFTECEIYRRRVIQLGEAPERVFNVGSLGVENILSISLMTLKELEESIDFHLQGKPYSVVTFHPVTMEEDKVEIQIRELIGAMEQFPQMNYIITLANADAGGRAINRIWEQEAPGHSNWVVVPSLGTRRYLSALRYAAMMIGNSSSGIMEGPASHTPTINIGDRQKGRVMAESILCCPPTLDDIESAMRKALTPEFQKIAQNVSNPFGTGNTSEQIAGVIYRFLNRHPKSIQKQFYNIPFQMK